jgi:hypothetical protein
MVSIDAVLVNSGDRLDSAMIFGLLLQQPEKGKAFSEAFPEPAMGTAQGSDRCGRRME